MNLVGIIIVIATTGLIFWLHNRFAPIDARTKRVLNAGAILVIAAWIITGYF